MTTVRSPVRIFLDMPTTSPLANVIRQVLPSVGENPTHVYVETSAKADLVFDDTLVERAKHLADLGAVIGWAYNPPALIPLNSDAWIVKILGMQKVESLWLARRSHQ